MDNAVVIQDLVGRGCGWPVRAFGDDLRFDVARITAGDHVLQGRRHEDVALDLEQLLLGDRARPREPGNGPVLCLPADHPPQTPRRPAPKQPTPKRSSNGS